MQMSFFPAGAEDRPEATVATLKAAKLCGHLAAASSVWAGLKLLNFTARQIKTTRSNSSDLRANIVDRERVVQQGSCSLRVHVARRAELAVHMTTG